MINTQVVLLNDAISKAQHDAMDSKLDQMTAEGKTDGKCNMIYNTPTRGQQTIIREWVDNAAAEEWLSFIRDYDLISAEIIP